MPEKAVTLTVHEWDYINKMLGFRPHNEVDGLLKKIVNQLNSKPPTETPNE